ncbi:hypothetical protein ACFSHT_05305 [Paraburkholderia silviterrae]|uniref:Uncharacterized protein n=1 Tax=Paraburkholderia silviterrae TaxID=2528715 RepID=A0A4V6PJ24_9BURK|nr:hypothetical protein [Paraburkholderia silviterrae]TDG20573.1 hypothetical protein EYW47_25700 [Paraburkholderia silviterrae]
MNRPYLGVEAILEQFRSGAEASSCQPAATHCLQWLAEFLAREHATMNAEDWDALVHVGGLLWRAGRKM